MNAKLYCLKCKAKAVQKYPKDKIKWANLEIYVIPRASLNYCEKTQKDFELKEMLKSGVFG